MSNDELGLRMVLEEDLCASVFEQINDVFEAFLAAVVGVWHMGIREMGAEGNERNDFVMELTGGIEVADVGFIGRIHGHDEVECGKIGGGQFA